MSETTGADATPSFEQSMDELEDCVARLESGDLTLEESLAIFERGVAASRACALRLEQSRQRVQVLVEKAGGDFQLEFLDPDGDGALGEPADDGDGGAGEV